MSDVRVPFAGSARVLIERRNVLGARGIAIVAELADLGDRPTLGEVFADLELRRRVVAIVEERDAIDRAIDALGNAARTKSALRFGIVEGL